MLMNTITNYTYVGLLNKTTPFEALNGIVLLVSHRHYAI